MNQNLRTEAHLELKQANNAWSECISRNFLPQWLQGANLNILEVCPNEYEKLKELDGAVYGEKPLPFNIQF